MVQRRVLTTYKAMTFLQRTLAVTAFILLTILGILFLVYNHSILAWLKPFTNKWRDIPGGWLILFALICITAFPPVIGYSTALTIAGMLYGFPNGWFVAAAGNIIGSFASFLVCRTFFSNYVHNLVGEDKRFAALASVLKHDGLKVLVMIRLCPLPYSLSNGAMSTFPTVSPAMFALATTIAAPKLMIHVFIGSRLGDLIDSGEKMDTATRIVNYASIIGGGLLGLGLGFYIYQRTAARARELELEESQALTRTPRPGELGDDDFGDSLDGALNPAAGMDDDDISLWDNEEEGYRDEGLFALNPARGGYVDEEAVIGSKGLKTKGLGI